MRFLSIGLLASFILFLLATPAPAGDADSEELEPKKVFVPVDDWDEVIKAEPDGILLTYDEYMKLRVAAERNRARRVGKEGLPPSACVLLGARYEARLEGKVLRIDAVLTMRTRLPGPSLLPLNLHRIGVTGAEVDGDDATLYRTPGGTLELFLEGKGLHELRLSLVVPVKERPSGKEVLLNLPKAPAAVFHALLHGDLEVETVPAFTRAVYRKDGDVTEVESSIGGSGTFFLKFRPKAIEAKLSPVIEVDSRLDLTVNGVKKARWTFDYTVHRASVKSLRWKLPKGWTISQSVEAPFPFTWKETDGVLEALFRGEQKGSFQIRVEMEREASAGAMTLPLLLPLGVDLLRGSAQVFVDKRFEPRLVTISGARIQDLKPVKKRDAVPFRAFQFDRPDPAVVIDLRTVEAKTRAFVRNLVRIDERQVRLTNRTLVHVKEGTLFGMEFGLPEGYTVDEIELHGAPGEWKTAQDGRKVYFTFPKPLHTGTRFQVRIVLRSTIGTDRREQTVLDLPVLALDAEEEEGVIAVSAPPNIRVKEIEKHNLTPLDPATQVAVFRIRDPEMRLAYRYRRPPYSAKIGVLRETPQVNLTSVVIYALRGSAVYAVGRLRYHIRKAGTDRVAFRLPPGAGTSVMIQGDGTKPATRVKSEDGTLWTVPLQSKVTGDFDLYVSFPLQLEGRGGDAVPLPWIRGEFVTAESGIVAVEASGEARIDVLAEGLEDTPPEEVQVPEELGLTGKLLFAYKYAKAGWNLSVKITRHETEEVAPVIVQRLTGTVQIDAEGGEKTSAVFEIQETGVQDLEIHVPGGFELWSLTLDGHGVKPARTGKTLTVPLDPGGLRHRVIKVVYRRGHNGVSFFGRFKTEYPEIFHDGVKVSVLASSMTVAVPADYRILAVTGSMTPLFDRPTPSSILRRAYEKYPALALLLVFAVVLGIALIHYRRKVTWVLQKWVTPNKVLVNALVGGTALVLLLVVLSTLAMNTIGIEAPGKKTKMKSQVEHAAGEAMDEDSILAETEYDDNDDIGRPEGEYGGRFGGKRNLRAFGGGRPKSKSRKEAVEEELERDVYDKEVAQAAPIVDPVLKDAEVAQERLRRASEQRKGADAWKAEEADKKSIEGKEAVPARQAGERMPGAGPRAGSPRGEPAAKKPAAPAEAGIEAEDRSGLSRGIGGSGEIGVDDISLIASTVDETDMRGLRTLALDLTGRGVSLPFRGEGGENRVGLYLLGRNFLHAAGFLLFVIGLFLPLAVVREWRRWAVASVAGALLALSALPEIVPAFSGACNLGVAGLMSGLVLLAVMPTLRWLRNVTARWVLPAVLLAVVLAGPSAMAGEKKKGDKPASKPSCVYIPYDPENVDGGIPIEKVFLPYREFLRLWDLAFPEVATRPLPVKAPYSHVEAQYVGEIGEGWFRGGAVFRVRTRGEDPVEVPLGLKGAFVEAVKANGKPASVREGKNGYTFIAPDSGSYTLEISFRVKTAGEGKSGELRLGLFPIPRSTAIVRLTDPVLTCEIPTAYGGLTRETGPDAEVVTAYLGAAHRLVVKYQPKEAGREGEFKSLKAKTVTYLVAEPGKQRVYHGCSLEVVGSGRDRFRFELEDDLRILGVKGPNIRAWGLREQDGKRTLEIHLQKPEEKSASYTIEALRSLEGPENAGTVPLLRPMDCMQERGLIVVETPPQFRLIVEKRGPALEPVDKTQTSPWKHPVAGAFRFTQRPVELDYSLRHKPVRLDGELRLASMVAEEDVRIGAFLAIHSTGAPTFRLATTLPAGYRLDGVHPLYGPGIKDWWEEGEGDERRLQIRLDKGLADRAGLVIWLSKKIDLKKREATLALPSLVLQDAETYRGRIVIHGFPGVRLQAKDVSGAEPEDAGTVWRDFCGSLSRPCPPVRTGALAFRFENPAYSGAVLAEAQAPVLSCTWTLHQRLRKDVVEYGIYLTYRAERAPAKSVAFSLPDWIPPDSVIIPRFPAKREELRERVQGRVVYRVGLQRGFLGSWRLAAHIRLPIEDGDASPQLRLPDLRPEGVGEGEVIGFVIVENAESGSELKITQAPEGLEKVDVDELRACGALPPSVEEQNVTFAYRAAQAWSASVSLETHEMDKGVDIEVNRIEILTAIRELGDSWNRVRFQVTNRTRQFLEVVMPEGARLLSLFVGSEAVKPGRSHEGFLLVPLQRGGIVNPSFTVELTYAKVYAPLSVRRLKLEHPVLRDESIKVGKIFWSLRVPEGYRYGILGDMREIEAKSLQEQIIQSDTQIQGRRLADLDNLPPQQGAKGILSEIFSNEVLILKTEKMQQAGQISNREADRLLQVQKDMQKLLTRKANTMSDVFEEQQRQLAARDIRRNTSLFNRGQAGFRTRIWEVLESKRTSWDFGDELKAPVPSTPWKGEAMQPVPTVPPVSAKGGMSLTVEPPPAGFREFHFIKEGKKANLQLRPWEDGTMNDLWTVVKFAGIVMIFLAALLLGWLQEWEGWPYRRLWIWLVLLVVCGAALSSWEFALVAGCIAAWLVYRETVRRSEERDKRKPGYVL